jgi:hypothetical protein
MPPPTAPSPPAVSRRRALPSDPTDCDPPAPAPAAPIGPRELWSGLSPRTRARIRQTVLHILQEAIHNADRR